MNLVEALVVTLACAAVSRFYLHMLQLESYQLDGYLRWMNNNRERLFGATLAVGLTATVASLLLPLFFMMFARHTGQMIGDIVTLVGFAAAALYTFQSQYAVAQKKPLVFTPRMIRLAACQCALILLLAGLLSWLSIPPYLLFIAVPYMPLASGFLMQPVEQRIHAKFAAQAQARLAQIEGLIKIGITGSFGKTSTKFALATILSEKYRTYASPGSTNTPMGLSRVINEQLEDDCEVFIAEMGSRHVGDIRELCQLVEPQYGVITSIGAAHLETFGNIATVANAKFELIESLPKDGCAFFGTGGEIDKLYARCHMRKVSAGIETGNVRAYDIESGPFGSRFTLARGEEHVRCETQLLGRHNIANITLASAVATELGMKLSEIARGIRKIQPVEHRLQLIRGPVSVIDDAFNSNPEGAKEALNVLSGFLGQRVIVTPGMVEMGEEEDRYNYIFGTQIAAVCDAAILVGEKHTKPIAKGLMQSGFDRNKLFVVASLEEAQEKLKSLVKSGDVVLFENDLPDNYS